jgi:hypothetical protein
MSVSGNIAGNSPKINATVHISTLPYYVGDYTVTPRLGEQVVLETAQKSMTQNVTVEQIPMYETTNLQGGKTVIIG